MRNFIPIILATLLAVASCLPMSKTSGIANVPYIKYKFGNESDRILVLPIWQKYPVAADDNTLAVLSFGKPQFLIAKDLPDLHKKISSKTSVAIVSPGAAVGRMIFIHGVTVISENGAMVTMSCPGNPMNPVASCIIHRELCVDTELKEKLIRLFKESKGEVSYSEKSILNYIITRPSHPEQPFKITNNSKEKQRVVEFLSGINDKCKTLQFLTETERVMFKAGVNIDDYTGNIEILLFKAVVNGDYKAMKVLLEGGADINTRSNNGITPLNLAVEKGDDESVRILLKAGANINARSDNDDTPLILAAMKGYHYIISILIDSGADLNVRNKDQNTALDIAILNGYVETIKLLKNAEAEE